VEFEIVGGIDKVQKIAVNTSIREVARLRKLYGKGRWRKLKGVAKIRMPSGNIRNVELHWYEAHGIGKGKSD
jgi:hypothetical protein